MSATGRTLSLWPHGVGFGPSQLQEPVADDKIEARLRACLADAPHVVHPPTWEDVGYLLWHLDRTREDYATLRRIIFDAARRGAPEGEDYFFQCEDVVLRALLNFPLPDPVQRPNDPDPTGRVERGEG